MLKKVFFTGLLLIIISGFYARSQDTASRQAWVDSVFFSLSMEERIAQLMIVRANEPGKDYFKYIDRYISDFNIGGVCFFRNHPHHQALTTNRWQEMAKTPLLVSIDAEWGLGMRLDSTPVFPFQMTLGAVQDNDLIYRMGVDIAAQCKRIGVNMNFAPVVDINSNPSNPVIGMRSFGQDRDNVMLKGMAYMRGLQENGIIATAKHFPGHGDTDTDSHKTLPVIAHSKNRLDSLELYPFREMINRGLRGIMIAHLFIPSMENRPGLASTLSEHVVDGLLRNELGFNGLIVTDALDMKGVTRYHKPGDIEIMALKAGNDILLLPSDVPKAIRKISMAIENGELEADLVNERCRRVLAYKYDAGLGSWEHIETENLYRDLNSSSARVLNRNLYEKSVTLLRNESDLIPLTNLDTLNIAYLGIGGTLEGDRMAETLALYGRVTPFAFSDDSKMKDIQSVLEELQPFDLVILATRNTNIYAYQDYGISEVAKELIREITSRKKTVMVLFASPYAISSIGFKTLPDALLVSYQNNELSEEVAAEAVFGGIGMQGKLPVSVEPLFHAGDGLITSSTRMSFVEPEALGIDPKYILKADSIALSGIREKAYPGCQVLAAKDGRIFYHKSFGYHTYDNKQEVLETDLYDLASITKIAATGLAVMDQYGKGIVDIDLRLSNYLPYLALTDKRNVIIREMMAHQSRMKAWIPYFMYTVHDTVRERVYSAKISEDYPVRVAEGMYIHRDYDVIIFDSIRFSGLRNGNHYKYSDLGFYLLKEALEAILNRPFEQFVEMEYYSHLGLPTMGYLPLKRFPASRMVPTEDDKIFRKQLLRGDVHDQGAAMLGGVSGHAGLFSNAYDLAVIMQMFLQKGMYGGHEYLREEIVREFTKTQFPLNQNRRGIGFDKPMLQYDEDGPTCQSASSRSFGHAGFTGTYAWADPENGLIYVFLSNRVCPNAGNSRIMDLDIRTNLHQVFYDALLK